MEFEAKITQMHLNRKGCMGIGQMPSIGTAVSPSASQSRPYLTETRRVGISTKDFAMKLCNDDCSPAASRYLYPAIFFAGLLLVQVAAVAKNPLAQGKAKLLASPLTGKATCVTQNLACGQTVTGTLTPSDCALSDGTFVDFYEFQGTSSQAVVIDLKSTQFNTYLGLLDPDNEVAAADNDGGSGTNSHIEHTLDQAGAWTIAANNFAPGDEGGYNLSLACNDPAPPPQPDFLVDAKATGAWFDPSHDGEGWKIEIINPTTAIVYWFTFPPPGAAKAGMGNGQAWMIGVGEIKGDKIIIDEVNITKGAKFGPDFDPNDVVSENWGNMEFTFSGPDAGTMIYNGPPEWGSGSFDINRLSGVHDLSGQAKAAVGVDNVGSGISGSWFNPAHDGEGWIIEVIDAQTALIFWFTYDGEGNQAWSIGIGKLAGNKIFIDAPTEPKGTEFGAGFSSSDVVQEPWGTYLFSFDGCDAGRIIYANAQGLGADFLPIQRLSSIDSVGCTPFDPDSAPDNSIAVNPADPLLMAVKRKSGLVAEFFGEKQANGKADNINAQKIKDATGKDLTILTDDQNRPSEISDGSGNQLGITYTNDPQEVFFRATLKNGDQSVTRIDLRELKLSAQPAPPAAGVNATMRSGQAHAWVSQIKSGAAPGNVVKSAGGSTVLVEQCGAPVDNATVVVEVTADNIPLMTLPAPRSGAGVYTAAIPTTATPPASTPPEQMCNVFSDLADEDCAFVRRLELDEEGIAGACILASFGSMISALGDLADFMGSCVHSLSMMQEACNGRAPVGTQSSLDEFLCLLENEELDRSVDAAASNVIVRPIVTLPGKGAFVVDAENAPSEGPFPDFEFLFDDEVTITSFAIDPPDPAPNQGYVASATINCAPNSTQVNMSVSGTDGFSSSNVCFISGKAYATCRCPAGRRRFVTPLPFKWGADLSRRRSSSCSREPGIRRSYPNHRHRLPGSPASAPDSLACPAEDGSLRFYSHPLGRHTEMSQ